MGVSKKLIFPQRADENARMEIFIFNNLKPESLVMKRNPLKSLLRVLRPEKTHVSDGNRKVLILEGGGMRGVFLTGVLQAFTDHSFFPFDTVIGSSAGALTGCAYAAGQIYLSRDAFFGKLLSGKFIRPANIFNADRHILDLDWMIDTS